MFAQVNALLTPNVSTRPRVEIFSGGHCCRHQTVTIRVWTSPKRRPHRPHTLGTMTSTGWTIRRSFGSATDFHDRELPTRTAALGHVWIHQSDQPAVVLGSAQPTDLIDTAAANAAGWTVCRRRSGGGLVIIVPGTHVWVDLIIGKASPLWDDDIVRAFDWVGDRWAAAIGELTGTTPTVHRDETRNREAGRLLCFAGLGAGEIEIDGRKVLGLSQRRTRDVARFQTMLEVTDHAALLRPFARGPLAALLESPDLGPVGLDPDRPAAAEFVKPETSQIRHEAVVAALLRQLGIAAGEQPSAPVSSTSPKD